jgi:hypothetical protein
VTVLLNEEKARERQTSCALRSEFSSLGPSREESFIGLESLIITIRTSLSESISVILHCMRWIRLKSLSLSQSPK